MYCILCQPILFPLSLFLGSTFPGHLGPFLLAVSNYSFPMQINVSKLISVLKRCNHEQRSQCEISQSQFLNILASKFPK